ncbi:MAG TPA: LysM peptidoglycan-binding domain-containing protein [Chloroflexi bacterium]|nr:LysM peptidoglycan-binding domain-containing protein [Chloroflexota bacterium]
MVHDRTSKSIQAYNVFKLVVTLILILIIIILLLSARRGTAPPQVVEPTVAAQPTSAPQLTATPQPAEPAIAMPVLAVPQVGDDGTVTLSGTGPAGSTVEVWASGERIGRVTVGADGRWSFVASLDAGDYDFTARAVDAAGATLVESTPFRFTVPALVEAPTLLPPQVGDDGTVTLSGTGPAGSTVEVWASGERIGRATVGADGRWSFVAPLDAGDYDFTARAVDAAGATLVESTPFRFTVPALVEAPTLTTPRAGDSVTGGTLELEGTGQPGAEIEILDNGQVVGTAVVQADGTWAFDYKCDPGAHAITVQNAGDAASVSDAVSIEVAVASTPVPAVGMCSEGDIPMGIDQGMTYVVAQCEYMGLIAERTGVTLADLIAANPQVTNPNLIYSGQVLNLPPR